MRLLISIYVVHILSQLTPSCTFGRCMVMTQRVPFPNQPTLKLLLLHIQSHTQIILRMHVLLLGGHGKVALHLTPLLLNRGWSVTSVIRNPEHESEILELGQGHKGNLKVLLSSLEDVKSSSDAQKIINTVVPDYVVWSAGMATLTPHPALISKHRNATHIAMSHPQIK